MDTATSKPNPPPGTKKQENLLLHFASKLRLKNLLSREAKMTEHHSQETLMSQVYPHCRQAALCSTDAIFSKWCNSCKGSPRAFHLRAQAILKHVTRNRITLCCHLPLLCTSILHTEITPSEVTYSRKGSNFTHQVKKNISIRTSISKYTCPALCMTKSYTTPYRDFLTSWFSNRIWNRLLLWGFFAEFQWRLWKAHKD